MLVLTRRPNEGIVIDDNVDVTVHVTVLSVHGNKVLLGIAAPQHVQVYRKEVYDDLQSREVPHRN